MVPYWCSRGSCSGGRNPRTLGHRSYNSWDDTILLRPQTPLPSPQVAQGGSSQPCHVSSRCINWHMV